MKKWFQVPAVLALAFSAAALFAQDMGGKKDEGGCQDEKECCGDTHALFCGNEKCADNPKCKEACEKAGATLKAVGARFMELAKKEWGDKACECCDKSETKPCDKCREFCKTVIIPMIKERMTARLKEPAKEVAHASTAVDGQGKSTTPSVPCTFIKGDTCKVCVDEIASASFKKLKELKARKAGCCDDSKPKQ